MLFECFVCSKSVVTQGSFREKSEHYSDARLLLRRFHDQNHRNYSPIVDTIQLSNPIIVDEPKVQQVVQVVDGNGDQCCERFGLWRRFTFRVVV